MPFRRDFEVEIGTRYAQFSVSEVDLENTVALYNLGFESFQNSSSLYINYGIFLLGCARMEDYSTISAAVKQCRTKK